MYCVIFAALVHSCGRSFVQYKALINIQLVIFRAYRRRCHSDLEVLEVKFHTSCSNKTIIIKILDDTILSIQNPELGWLGLRFVNQLQFWSLSILSFRWRALMWHLLIKTSTFKWEKSDTALEINSLIQTKEYILIHILSTIEITFIEICFYFPLISNI